MASACTACCQVFLQSAHCGAGSLAVHCGTLLCRAACSERLEERDTGLLGSTATLGVNLTDGEIPVDTYTYKCGLFAAASP